MLRFSECKELAHFVEREQLRAVLLRKGKDFLANVQKKENIFCFALKLRFPAHALQKTKR
jgi:hypothetical protein